MSGDSGSDSGGFGSKYVKVMDFRDRDESEFQKPDRDPHGEMQASAAHSSTQCDAPECDASGLVPSSVVDEAAGEVRGVQPFAIVCSEECADALN